MTSSADGQKIMTFDAVATNANGTNDNESREEMLAHQHTKRSNDCKTCRLSYREGHSASACCDRHNHRDQYTQEGSRIDYSPTSPTRSNASGDYTNTSDSEVDPSDMDRRNESIRLCRT
jgi:hypothetical protein